MKDLQFYDAGCHPTKGVRRRFMLVVRRAVRRVLRPIFHHQLDLFRALFDRVYQAELNIEDVRQDLRTEVAILPDALKALARRQDELAARLETTRELAETALAIGWDHVALVRRLAALEDQLAALTGQQPPAAGDDAERRPSIPFPGLERFAPGQGDGDQVKVC